MPRAEPFSPFRYHGTVVYTCYEMMRDCRADLPAGWSYFLSNYVPAIRRLIAQYAPEKSSDASIVERTLLTSGTLDALLQSQSRGGGQISTPYLHVSYQPTWRFKQPPPPPPTRPWSEQ